jgi:hypothetical protein
VIALTQLNSGMFNLRKWFFGLEGFTVKDAEAAPLVWLKSDIFNRVLFVLRAISQSA